MKYLLSSFNNRKLVDDFAHYLPLDCDRTITEQMAQPQSNHPTRGSAS